MLHFYLGYCFPGFLRSFPGISRTDRDMEFISAIRIVAQIMWDPKVLVLKGCFQGNPAHGMTSRELGKAE